MTISLVVAGLLAPCADAEPEDSRIRVEFWHAMGGPEPSALLSDFVREFEALNPDIHVVAVYQGHYGQLSQKLIASVIARTNPACAQMYEGWTSRFLTRGLLDPVQNHIDGPHGFTREELEDIWEPLRRNNTWPEHGLVTLPFNKSCYVLYANLDMLQAAGYQKPPETWTELREVARALTVRRPGQATPEVYGLLLRSQIEAYSTFLFRSGERYLSDDWRSVAIDTPGALECLRFLNTLITEDRTAYTDNTNYPPIPFGAGQVAMYVHSSAAFPYNDRAARGKFEWVAAPLPHPEGRKDGILFQGTNVGIFSRPHAPEVREAAWRFLKFITNARNTARWSMATGYVVVRRSAVDVPEMQAFLEDHPNYRVPISLIPQATFDPRPHYWDQMRPQIATFAIEAMNGERSPAEAIEQIERSLQDIIDYEVR